MYTLYSFVIMYTGLNLPPHAVLKDHEVIQRTKQVPDDMHEIHIVEEVDTLELVTIPAKLQGLDYPKVSDAHQEDVAKVISKKFLKLGIDEVRTDAFNVLSTDHNKLQSRFMSWQARIDEAVEHEPDDFWEKVKFCCSSY